MNPPDEFDPNDIEPMGQEVQLAHFTHSLWRLVSRFQGEEFELSDPHVIYAFEDVKARMLEEIDLGTEMLENESDNELED